MKDIRRKTSGYSQNEEEYYILDYFDTYFGELKGTLLSCGENDGSTYSNCLALIEKGWRAHLVEPSPAAYRKLMELHLGNARVKTYPFAIALVDGPSVLYESGNHVGADDIGLLSTLNEDELKRWGTHKFVKMPVQCRKIETLFKDQKFDFVSIDCEGMDLAVLYQLDLSVTKLICVEHNSKKEVRQCIIDYCKGFELETIVYENSENILIGI